MIDRLQSDIEALLGASVSSTDPAESDRRDRLAADLASAIMVAPVPSAMDPPDATILAAYVDQGLTDAEKQSLFRAFTATPSALAEVDAMTALLARAESAPLRTPEAGLARARALLTIPAKQCSPNCL